MQSNFAELYEKSFQDIKIGEVVKGTVIAVHEKDIVVDIAYKAEGILPKDEFSQPELLTVGSEVEVLFEGFNDVEGTADIHAAIGDLLFFCGLDRQLGKLNGTLV